MPWAASRCRAGERRTPSGSWRMPIGSRRPAALRSCSRASRPSSRRGSPQTLSIPTIGIGAGPHCSGQVLVLHDVLGLTQGHRPKFVRTYVDGFDLLQQALAHWAEDVRSGAFPSAAEVLRPAGRCPGGGCRLGVPSLHQLMRPVDAHLPHDQVPDPVPARLPRLKPADRLRADHGLPARRPSGADRRERRPLRHHRGQHLRQSDPVRAERGSRPLSAGPGQPITNSAARPA